MAPAAQQDHVGIRTFEDFPVLDTTGCAKILRGADQAGHKMVVNMQSHPHQIVSINLVAFIKQFWTFGSAILRKTNASRRLWKTSRRKRCGALRKAWNPMYKERQYSEYSILKACHRPAPDDILLSKKNHIGQTIFIHSFLEAF